MNNKQPLVGKALRAKFRTRPFLKARLEAAKR